MKGRLLLIAALIIAAWLALTFASYKQPGGTHNQPFTLPSFNLPHLNLNAAPALAASLNQSKASSSSPGYTVTGAPTISASFINQVLAHYDSPAANTGAILYNLGVKYGIDPVFALAVFLHESDLGRSGMARTTLSLGNLRCTAAYACYKGYAAFPRWQAGYEAFYALIRNLYVNKWGLRTVGSIIPTYAPASDHNNPSSYVQAVENSVDKWRAGRI